MPDNLAPNSFHKQERLCGKTNISSLITKGKWGTSAHIKFCWIFRNDGQSNRVMVSVPKKFFKRAVKRNLLKRRLREAYRTQKELLPEGGFDLMFTYSNPAAADFGIIRDEVASAMTRIGKNIKPSAE